MEGWNAESTNTQPLHHSVRDHALAGLIQESVGADVRRLCFIGILKVSLLTSAPTARRYLESALRRNDGLRVLLASVLVLMGIPSGAAAATFTASLDRDTISVAESATLSL